MAKFTVSLPEEMISQFRKLYKDADRMMSEMTLAGAWAVYENIEKNAPPAFKDSNIMDCLKITRTYVTPSDHGINTKIAFYGYFETKDGRVMPAPLVANVFEHGRSNLPFPKQPFLRKSFRRANVRDAMLNAQKEYSGGLLDE